jgi:hypothetical protein
MSQSEYEDVAPTQPDKLRRKDIESFKAFAAIEGREIISEEKISDELFLRKTFVTSEIFDFYYASKNVTYRFNVRDIKDAIVAEKIAFRMFKATLTEKWQSLILRHGGVEEERIPLVRNVNRPGIVVLWPDGNSLLIDGNHRLIARWRRGLRSFRYAAVAFDDIRPYTLYCEGRSQTVGA